MGALGLAGMIFHKELNVDPNTIAGIVAMLTPALVYVWPNAPKDK